MVRRHRHIVAIPPVLLLVVVSLWGEVRGTDVQGSVVTADTVIWGGEGFHSTPIGESVLSSWSGFFFAKESDGNLSVAALSSPVLIRTKSNAVLVPIGWQWRTDGDLTRIPRHFFQHHLKTIVTYSTVPVPSVFVTPDSWLVASVHPLMADRVWVMEDPDGMSDADHVIRLMGLSQSDILPDALALFTIERWGIEVREYLEGAEDPRIFLNQLVPHVVKMIQWFTQQGYPERSARYREAIENIAGEFRVFLSEESKGVLKNVHSNSVMVRDVADFGITSPETISEPIPFDAEAIKQQAYGLMRDMGALFTINTEIIPVSPSSAEIHEIVFEDHVFDFVLDSDQRILDGISMDGKVMAYPMGIEEFIDWVASLE